MSVKGWVVHVLDGIIYVKQARTCMDLRDKLWSCTNLSRLSCTLHLQNLARLQYEARDIPAGTQQNTD